MADRNALRTPGYFHCCNESYIGIAERIDSCYLARLLFLAYLARPSSLSASTLP